MGGYHTKLTGAGGGGCVIGFKPRDSQNDIAGVTKKLEEAGFSVVQGIQNSQDGMRYEILK